MTLAAQAAPPYKYYVLAPEQLSADLSVMSLEPGNTVGVGSIQLALGEYERKTLPAVELQPGTVLSGTARYSVGSTGNATDLLAPDFFAGTSFVVPHIGGTHRYYVQATTTTANITLHLGTNTQALQLTPGTAYEIDGGSDNGISGWISSDQPIVVAHVADVSGSAAQAYPVPPASTELVGIRSQSAAIGANTNGTSVTVYASDGSSTTYSLNAGEKVTVAIGASGSQGTGSAVRLVSNFPIAAVQYDDGDGNDASAFWPIGAFASRFGIPVNAQYVAVACTQANVVVQMFKGASAPETQTCSASGNTPGKVYFGANTSGNNLAAGWYLKSSAPVYVMYEAAASEDEHNLSGAQTAIGPATPTLTSLPPTTTSNPLSISGTAPANTAVRLFVNGLHQQTVTASGAGTYAFDAELNDGNNVLYAVAVSSSGDESDSSNVEQTAYTNTVPRNQSGTISGNVVWTPGSPASTYFINGNLTIASGAKLVLQAGTTLQFASGVSLTANGVLKISGTVAAPVSLTSSAAFRGSWAGVVLNSAGSEINGATIEWASLGVQVNGVAVTVRNSTIRNFVSDGILTLGAGANGSLIQGNLIDNLSDTGDCIEAQQSSPTITGNTLTNCGFGLHLNQSNSVVSGNNVITGNGYGVQMWGGNSVYQPTVTGNQIYGNNSLNVRAEGFGAGASTTTLNYTGNWWGTTNPTTIAGSIQDLSDNWTANNIPAVNFGAYRSGSSGASVAGNYLTGWLTTSTTLTGGATYDVLGVLIVASGKTVTIPAGTTLRFHGNAFLVVDGTLTVAGTTANPATLTSGRASRARGDWYGIYVRSGSGTVIDHALIEWGSVGVQTDAASTVRNSTIRNFGTDGIWMVGAGSNGGVIQGNVIDNLNDNADCIEALQSNLTITGNTLTNCNFGLHLNQSNSVVSGNNVITGNGVGVQMWGGNGIYQPTVTGNQIFGNNSLNVRAEGFGSGAANTKLNYTGNWWGTTNPTSIATTIQDLSDNPGANNVPLVDFSNFLDGPGGSSVPGNYLIGQFTAVSTTLTSGATYDVLGATYVPSGKTLSIPSGATLRFHDNAFLVVDGTLNVSGTTGNPVTFTSGRSSPARGNWSGIYVRSGSGSVIDHALIEWASVGVQANGVAVTVSNSTIRNFSSDGILMIGAGANGGVIQGNLIDNLNDSGDCVEAQQTSPTITGNTFTNCGFGLHLNQANSQVTGNVITSNGYGVQMWGGNSIYQPAVTGNQIFANNVLNARAEGFGTGAANTNINFTGNWWGTTNATVIAGAIQDLSDNPGADNIPNVDFGAYLNGPNGSAVAGNYLIGKLAAASTTLTAGTTYDVLGVFFVPPGKSLAIPAGAKLRFHGNSFLVADGTLTVSGTSGNLVTFTSGRSSPANGDWRGILVRNTGQNVSISGALIEWTDRAVEVQSTNAIVRNSVLQHFATAGVAMTGSGASSQIADNVIDNFTNIGDGINLTSASPSITGNGISRTSRAIFMMGSSNPTVAGNNLSGNTWGINLFGAGSNSATAVPRPTITGNNIFGNSFAQIELYQYGNANPAVLSATGNWWGTPTPAVGAQILLSNGTPSSALDFSSPASSAISSDPQIPTPPTVLQVTDVSDSQVSLSWSGATDNVGVVRYRLERCMGDGCSNFAEIAMVLSTAYTDGGLTAATRYRYRVRAEDAVGNLSAYSIIVDGITVLDSQPPSAPSGLVVMTVSSTQIDLQWTAATDNLGVALYLIERCAGASCSTFSQVGTTSGLRFRSTGLTFATSYSYRVRAQDTSSNPGAYSAVQTVITRISGADCD